MQIISSLDGFQAPWENCTVTLGDFDGLHRGHRKLLDTTIKFAQNNKQPCVLITYDPSPKKVLKKLKTDMNLFTRNEKVTLLQAFNIRAVIFLPFDIKMANMSAKDFLKKILIEKLKANNFIIGYDHHFGKNREGNFSFLKKYSKNFSFNVKQVSPVKLWNETISSSRIRKLLQEGRIKKANRLLGSPFILEGVIIRGKGRGNKIGIPTANINIPSDKIIPKEGVYAATAILGTKKYLSVVNIGNNPTFENINLSVEVHIIGFNQDIYGTTLVIEIQNRIRNEKKFASIDQLVSQIKKDINKVSKNNKNVKKFS